MVDRQVLEQVRALHDPTERARAAVAAMREVEALLDELRFVRNLAIAEIHSRGDATTRQLAELYGVSKSLIATITG